MEHWRTKTKMNLEKRTKLIVTSLKRIVEATQATIRKADNSESNPVTETGRLAMMLQDEADKLSQAGIAAEAVGTFLICAHFISGQTCDPGFFAKLNSF